MNATLTALRCRPAVGPLLTIAAVGATVLANRYFFVIPNPGSITFLAVVFAAYYGGVASGLVSAAISIAYAAAYFSAPDGWLHFTPTEFVRITILVVATPAAAILVGVLHAHAARLLQNEREIRRQVESADQELRSLRAALDQSDVGIVILDHELRAQFVNHAYRRIWHVPDSLADSKPAFVGLLYHARDGGSYALPISEVDSFIAKRIAMVQIGDETPLDLRLANGSVIRFQCKVLSDGGRMLNYGNISDLVHQADELAELATTDALTGVYNRRHFLKELEREWGRYARYRHPLSLLMLDIDSFKSVNDRYGHDAGDQVIIFAARMCNDGKRASDSVARLGGEEFAILLPETSLEQACIVAERLRMSIAQASIPCGRNTVTITVSIGAAVADEGMSSPAGLMKRADEMLYAAKRSGKNGVCAAGDGRQLLIETAAA